MYFEGFDYKDKTIQNIHISFIANKIVYIDGDVRRTSYYLTDDRYNLMLSTLEIESNLKLTIHEMIFHLHLEKASYDKAVNDIKICKAFVILSNPIPQLRRSWTLLLVLIRHCRNSWKSICPWLQKKRKKF